MTTLYCCSLLLLLRTLPNVYFFFYSLSLRVYLNWLLFECQETKIEIQLPPRLLSSISLTSLVKPLWPLFVCTGATAVRVQQYSGTGLQPCYTYGVLFLGGAIRTMDGCESESWSDHLVAQCIYLGSVPPDSLTDRNTKARSLQF